MLDESEKKRLAEEGVDYLIEQNILLKNKVAQLVAENNVLKNKLKKVVRTLKDLLVNSKKIFIAHSQ